MRTLQFLLITTVTCLMGLSAQAYYSTMDTGNILEKGKYKFHLETQFITSNDTGLNINGYFDMGLTEDSGIRGIIGVGTTDFHIGGFYKWAPIPDMDTQPAMGLLLGVTYASFSGVNNLSLRLHPIISKTFKVEIGEIIPYGSIPIGILSISNDRGIDIPIQLALGTELKTLNWKNITFMAEINFDIQKSFSYFGLSANIDFDEEGIYLE